jgi:DNA polymerase-3 subunit alpha
MKDFDSNTAAAILKERENGTYSSLENFMRRVPISVEQLQILINVGAFRFTGKSKQKLLLEIYAIIGSAKKTSPERMLFDVEKKNYAFPQLTHHWLNDAWDEISILGFPLVSPFKLLRDRGDSSICVADLKNYSGQTVSIIGYLITYKPTRTKHGEPMMFGTFIDSEGKFFDTTHFPKIAAKYPLKSKGCYLITGKVAEEFAFYSIDVSEMTFLNVMIREDGITG